MSNGVPSSSPVFPADLNLAADGVVGKGHQLNPLGEDLVVLLVNLHVKGQALFPVLPVWLEVPPLNVHLQFLVGVGLDDVGEGNGDKVGGLIEVLVEKLSAGLARQDVYSHLHAFPLHVQESEDAELKHGRLDRHILEYHLGDHGGVKLDDGYRKPPSEIRLDLQLARGRIDAHLGADIFRYVHPVPEVVGVHEADQRVRPHPHVTR